MEDHRVRGRYVETAFDDGGRQQHVELTVVERRHDLFEPGRDHAAMGFDNLDFRNELLEPLVDPRNILDARADIVCLTASVELPHDGLANDHRIVMPE